MGWFNNRKQNAERNHIHHKSPIQTLYTEDPIQHPYKFQTVPIQNQYTYHINQTHAHTIYINIYMYIYTENQSVNQPIYIYTYLKKCQANTMKDKIAKKHFNHTKHHISSIHIPVDPHKAMADVSKIRNVIGEVACCEPRMAERIH